ncbi:hypothetical protein BST33_10980, partial [Mycolicibacter minnesotensis]
GQSGGARGRAPQGPQKTGPSEGPGGGGGGPPRGGGGGGGGGAGPPPPTTGVLTSSGEEFCGLECCAAAFLPSALSAPAPLCMTPKMMADTTAITMSAMPSARPRRRQ